MAGGFGFIGGFVFVLQFLCTQSILVIVPEDVPTALVGIYGFAPKIVKGNEARVGFGFRFGNHADFQVLYEFGPQAVSRNSIEPLRARSASWSARQSSRRRRPFIELLLRAGLLKEVRYRFTATHDYDDSVDDEPR